MPLHLYAEPGTKPLGWEFRERLTGEKREAPYHLNSPTGPVATPEKINAALARLRGLVQVDVLIEHKVSPDAPVTVALVPEIISFELHAPSPPFALDGGTLGTAFYRELKPYVEAYRNNEGGTPGEVYAMEAHAVEARTIIEPPEPPEPPEDEYEDVVRYRDRETGHYVSEDKWRRSRAAKRGAARRAGKSRAGAGRYVRVVERRKKRK